jgi:hypothetical protein
MQTQMGTTMQTIALSEALEDVKLFSELRTDDGFLVTEVTTRFGDLGVPSRSNWVRDLLTTFSSSVLSRISQRLTLTTAWSAYIAAVILYGDQIAPEAWDVTQFRVPGWPHELVGGFLSILVVFRTDQAYGRFWEARRHWASCSATCKSISRLVLANLPAPLAQEFIALLAIFPTALRQHLRGEVNKRELSSIYNLYLPQGAPLTHRPQVGVGIRPKGALFGQEEEAREVTEDKTGSHLEVVLSSKNMPMTIVLYLSCLAAPLRVSFSCLTAELPSSLPNCRALLPNCRAA